MRLRAGHRLVRRGNALALLLDGAIEVGLRVVEPALQAAPGFARAERSLSSAASRGRFEVALGCRVLLAHVLELLF